MDRILERADELQQALTDFVLDAEGDLATALEAYSAEQLGRWSKQPSTLSRPTELVVDQFITDGTVGGTTPLALFLTQYPDLSERDRTLVQQWQRRIMGLFAVTKVEPEGFKLMNWLTAKPYDVWVKNAQEQATLERLKPGEIVLTRIVPLDEERWIFSGPATLLGKLGKPKLAVAIGQFKDNHKPYLYSDAPDLLEEAWRSVERYHQDFLDFFGSDELTLPGHQLDKKLSEFQGYLTQQQMDAADIDTSKSLKELAQESGVSEEEMLETAEALGMDAKAAAQFFQAQSLSKMMAPEIRLPDSLKRTEQVTLLSHPRWGQMFLTSYGPLCDVLADLQNQADPAAGVAIARKALEQPEMNTFVWHRLAKQYPQTLEALLQQVLDDPSFELQRDLDTQLKRFDHPLEPELPETASVPIHLHNLFQDALQEVSKNHKKKKQKQKSGFGA